MTMNIRVYDSAKRKAPGLEEIAFADKKFKTPSGKIELISEEASKKWKVSGNLPAE